jgi:HB1, ASXL, restriction endonuclease HTH domain
VERTLYDLGIASPELLQRGADIDRAAERLIIDAAADLGPRRVRPSATTLSRSVGTASLVNHALASGDPRAVSLLHSQPSAQREAPEALQILKPSGKPLTSAEITERALAGGLIVSCDKTPVATMDAELYRSTAEPNTDCTLFQCQLNWRVRARVTPPRSPHRRLDHREQHQRERGHGQQRAGYVGRPGRRVSSA